MPIDLNSFADGAVAETLEEKANRLKREIFRFGKEVAAAETTTPFSDQIYWQIAMEMIRSNRSSVKSFEKRIAGKKVIMGAFRLDEN
ncbi:hypothetical protein [Bacillus mycoides]|uniref:hypothetical protein n=1 Tax=Bacillus mycoides TaxID=1405 RepID=UPI003A8035C1